MRDDTNLAVGDGDRLRVAVFAGMAQIAGRRVLEIPWRRGSVAVLREAVASAHPELVPLLARSAISVGSRHVADDAEVLPGADVAILPPVSGG